MDFSKISIDRPVTTVMMVLVIILVGTVSLMGIPMDLLPEIELPVAIVYVQYPNAAPEEVETMVTIPLEQSLASVSNLENISSMTTEGTSIIMVEFTMDTDMDFATLDMREKVGMVQGFLPEGTADPMVMKMNMDFAPTVQIYVSAEKSLAELNREVEDNVLSYIERSPGVASVSMYGGVTEEVSIDFEQEKLAGYGLSLSVISQMLAAENINLPSGEVSKGSTKLIVRTMGEFQSVDEIKQLPIPLADRSVIRLSDLGTIEQGLQEQSAISRIDEIPAIGLTVTKQSSANTVDVSEGVASTLETLRADFPELSFTVGFDQAIYINRSVSSVVESALIGALLAILVIFLFLRSISSTMIIAISIPTSFFATFAVMNLLDMTLNLITLAALTLAVGMLVDNSIVALENIFRVSQEDGGRSAYDSSLIGAKQIALALSASTLTSVVVYLPIALSTGIASTLFADFCWTFIIALLVSLVVAISVVPMLSSRMLNRGGSFDYVRIGRYHYRYRLIPYFTRFINWLTDFYGRSIVAALKHRKKVLLVSLLIFVISFAFIAMLGMEFLPAADEAMFTVNVEMPYGTSVEEKDALLTEMEGYLMTLPELNHCAVNIGQMSMMGSSNTSIAVTLVSKEDRDRSVWKVIDEVKQEFSHLVGAKISIMESSSVTSMMGGSDLAISIKGPELTGLRTIGDDLAKQLMALPGVDAVSTSMTEGNPEVKVIIDRNTAAFYGVTAYQLATGLEKSISGATSTNLKIGGEEIEVNLSLSENYQTSIDNMQQILIPTATGGTVPVGQIASLEFGNSPSQIDRDNQQRYLTINVTIDGDDLAGVSEDVMALIQSYPFPDTYSYEEGGLYEQMVDAFGDLFIALLVAILLVFMVLASQFESVTQPFIVMMAIPFAMSGTFLTLFFTGNTLSITSFLGLIMLAGIVVNNAILLIEFIRQNKNLMDRDQAIINAGKHRLRPILMTTITTCVGMVPLSLGLGDGGEYLAPLGVSIIGGLLGSTIITLILIPVLYAIMDDSKIRRLEKKRLRNLQIQSLEEKWRTESN